MIDQSCYTIPFGWKKNRSTAVKSFHLSPLSPGKIADRKAQGKTFSLQQSDIVQHSGPIRVADRYQACSENVPQYPSQKKGCPLLVAIRKTTNVRPFRHFALFESFRLTGLYRFSPFD